MESRLLKLLTIDLSEKIFSKEFSKEFRYQVYLCWLIFLLPKLLSSSKKFVNFVTQKDVLLISLFQYLNLNFTSKIRKWVSDTKSEILHSCQTEVWLEKDLKLRIFRTSSANNFLLTVCSYHVTYEFQSESTLYSCLNVKELLARNRCYIWNLSDCNETWTHNHLIS